MLNEQYSDAKFYNNKELQKSLKTEIDALFEDFNAYPFEFIENHKSSFASFQALETQLRNKQVKYEDLERSYNSLSSELKLSQQGQEFKTKLDQYKIRLEQSKATDIGAKAPEFSAPTPLGEDLALSDVYTKGKITIVDFI